MEVGHRRMHKLSAQESNQRFKVSGFTVSRGATGGSFTDFSVANKSVACGSWIKKLCVPSLPFF